jgi:hypothetical protein
MLVPAVPPPLFACDSCKTWLFRFIEELAEADPAEAADADEDEYSDLAFFARFVFPPGEPDSLPSLPGRFPEEVALPFARLGA